MATETNGKSFGEILNIWEEVVIASATKEDIGGRRSYTLRELEMIMRLKHLIVDKKFTIEGARDQIISESDLINQHANLLMQFNDMRAELSDLYFYAKKNHL